jgi:hypothetical protein
MSDSAWFVAGAGVGAGLVLLILVLRSRNQEGGYQPAQAPEVHQIIRDEEGNPEYIETHPKTNGQSSNLARSAQE